MSDFKDKVSKAIVIYEEMTEIVDTCRDFTGNLDMWEIHWDSFWELSNNFPFSVGWTDFDTSYEEDIMQRYLAIQYFMEDLGGL